MNKVCSYCGCSLPPEAFYKDITHTDGLSSRCKQCRSQLDKIRYTDCSESIKTKNKGWYQAHKIERAAKNKKWREEHSVELRQKRLDKYQKSISIAQSLKTPCAKCGETRIYLIQFHHIDPQTKLFQICGVGHHSEKEINDEVKKCVCLCANCHKEYHHFYGQKPVNPTESIAEYLSERTNSNEETT